MVNKNVASERDKDHGLKLAEYGRPLRVVLIGCCTSKLKVIMLANQRVTPSSSEPIRRRINEIHKTGAERGKVKGTTAIG